MVFGKLGMIWLPFTSAQITACKLNMHVNGACSGALFRIFGKVGGAGTGLK